MGKQIARSFEKIRSGEQLNLKSRGFTNVASLIARHGTPPVPPVLRYTKAPGLLAGVRPAAVSDATLVKPRLLRLSCSPLRIFSKLRAICFPMVVSFLRYWRAGC